MLASGRRSSLHSLLVLALTLGAALGAQNLDAIGPQVGARVPDFSGTDQFGRTQTLQSVLARDGAMIVFFRSADW